MGILGQNYAVKELSQSSVWRALRRDADAAGAVRQLQGQPGEQLRAALGAVQDDFKEKALGGEVRGD